MLKVTGANSDYYALLIGYQGIFRMTDTKDNGGARSGKDRRQDPLKERNPDRRSGKDRRKGFDRRSGIGRRRDFERRDIHREVDN